MIAKLIADSIQIAPSGGFQGIGTGPLANPGDNAAAVFSNFISGVVGVMTIVAIIWTIFTIITGAISMINSGGDKQAVESARKRITNGVIGLIVVLIALLIIEVVGYLLGLKNILNIQCLINMTSGKSCT